MTLTYDLTSNQLFLPQNKVWRRYKYLAESCFKWLWVKSRFCHKSVKQGWAWLCPFLCLSLPIHELGEVGLAERFQLWAWGRAHQQALCAPTVVLAGPCLHIYSTQSRICKGLGEKAWPHLTMFSSRDLLWDGITPAWISVPGNVTTSLGCKPFICNIGIPVVPRVRDCSEHVS